MSENQNTAVSDASEPIDSKNVVEQHVQKNNKTDDNNSDHSSSGDDAFVEDDTTTAKQARLYSKHASDASWIEMGVGVLSIVVTEQGYGSGQQEAKTRGKYGKTARSSETLTGEIEMRSVEQDGEILLKTPISLEDIYVVNTGTILAWKDPHLGRDIACSFLMEEECRRVKREIADFQEQAIACLAEGPATKRFRRNKERWEPRRENLEFIIEDATRDRLLFGEHLKKNRDFVHELMDLFKECRAKGEDENVKLICKIVFMLLTPPYSTDSLILSYFVDDAVIDTCIEAVQVGLGRVDRGTGFVSMEERLQQFRNPCQLPDSIQKRIHSMSSFMFLRDLLPLSLDEGDGLSVNMFGFYMQQFKLKIIEDIFLSETILPHAFERAAGNAQQSYELLKFLYDASKSIKNGSFDLSSKMSLYAVLVNKGLFTFMQTTFKQALVDHHHHNSTVTNCRAESEALSSTVEVGTIQLCCDLLTHCTTLFSDSRGDLLTEANNAPEDCILALLLQTMTTVETSAELQSAFDAVLATGITGLLLPSGFLSLNPNEPVMKNKIQKFWIEGPVNSTKSPAVFHLCTALSQLLESVATLTNAGTTVLPRGLELQLQYSLRLLSCMLKEVDNSLCGALCQIFSLSSLLPKASECLGSRHRRLANLQASVVSFISTVMSCKSPRGIALVDGETGALETCMTLYLSCIHRNNMLSCALGNLFAELCDCVHKEKAQSLPPPHQTVFEQSGYVRPLEDDSQANVPADSSRFQGSLSSLMQRHSDTLERTSAALIERMRHALAETPLEAAQTDAESSSIVSGLERHGGVFGGGGGEFETLAYEFGVEAAPAMAIRIPTPPPPTEEENEEESLRGPDTSVTATLDSFARDENEERNA